MQQGESFASLENRKMIKIFMVGAGGVGKTSLTRQFVNNDFNDWDYHYDEYLRKLVEVDGHEFMLDIFDNWHDIEEFPTMIEELIKICHIFVFVYDIANQYSFEEIVSLMKKIKEVKNGTYWFGIIAGNKCDLDEQRQVARNEAEKYENKPFKLKYYETSAKKNINVDELFYECARLYVYGHEMYNDKVQELSYNQDEKCMDKCTML